MKFSVKYLVAAWLMTMNTKAQRHPQGASMNQPPALFLEDDYHCNSTVATSFTPKHQPMAKIYMAFVVSINGGAAAALTSSIHREEKASSSIPPLSAAEKRTEDTRTRRRQRLSLSIILEGMDGLAITI
ncbi:hypothetical protein ACHAW5_004314 [Stephanodiscus triporus]|uniref:Secreted protein n=1 Tax=Stephanodiscus triporus TaxID=2934178 RepID=A0ABD3QPI0_9STRA